MESKESYLSSHDLFGKKLNITLYGKSQINTNLGGILSIGIKIFMILYSYGKFTTVLFRKDNQLGEASFLESFEDIGKIPLDSNQIMFQMVDPDFDNFDNPYLQFKFFMTGTV